MLTSSGDIAFTADIANGKETFYFLFNKGNTFRFIPKVDNFFKVFTNSILDKDGGTYSADDIIASFEKVDN